MFRDRLIGAETLIGTWVKTPSPIVVEVLANTALDSGASGVVVPHVRNADEIVAVDGPDAVFLGPADLSVSIGADGPGAIEVRQAIDRVVAASLEASVSIGIFANTKDQFDTYRSQGITLLLMQSDHVFLLAGARQLAEW